MNRAQFLESQRTKAGSRSRASPETTVRKRRAKMARAPGSLEQSSWTLGQRRSTHPRTETEGEFLPFCHQEHPLLHFLQHLNLDFLWPQFLLVLEGKVFGLEQIYRPSPQEASADATSSSADSVSEEVGSFLHKIHISSSQLH